MEITTSELPNLVGKVLVVQIDVKDQDDEDYREVTGKCVIATDAGFVLQARNKSVMIKMADVIDVDVKPKPRRLARRWLGPVDDETLRQHLLDRHGFPYELVRKIDTAMALTTHGHIDHSKLGHEHGDKPARRAGRPKREE